MIIIDYLVSMYYFLREDYPPDKCYENLLLFKGGLLWDIPLEQLQKKPD